MSSNSRRGAPLWTILLALLFVAPLALLATAYFASSVSGTVTLPNGIVANITGSFGASESGSLTTIEAASRKFAFTQSAVLVDGVAVARLDESVRDVSLTAIGGQARLVLNGAEVPLPKR